MDIKEYAKEATAKTGLEFSIRRYNAGLSEVTCGDVTRSFTAAHLARGEFPLWAESLKPKPRAAPKAEAKPKAKAKKK